MPCDSTTKNRPEAVFPCFLMPGCYRSSGGAGQKMIGFTADMLEAIDKWRARQRPIPNVSDAIRQLIEAGIKATAKR
jgi:hypothetical protein